MTNDTFNQIMVDQFTRCVDILGVKSDEYARDADRLHNFKLAAGMMGVDEKEALFGMFAKHVISINDMCRDGVYHDLSMWNEKITDAINYLILLRAVVYEQEEKQRPVFSEQTASDEVPHSGRYPWNEGK